MVERRSVTILGVLLLALGAAAQGAGPFQQVGADGLVIIECEDYDANVSQGGHDWVLVTDPPGFSGKGAMQALPDNGANVNTGYVTGSPRLDYKVNFVKTGTVYVWVRAYGPDGSADSLHSSLDEQVIATADRISNFATAYTWTNTAYQDPERIMFEVKTPGLHTFNLYMREDGTIVDKVVLTTNPNYTPTGMGPSLKATNPSPANGQTGVAAPLMTWTQGVTTLMNRVYLGKTSDLGPKDVVSAQQPFAVYFHVPGFEPGVTYYWRIDGIEADMTTTYTGDVWSFTAAPTTAYAPGPRNGDKWIAKDAALTWLPGQGAVAQEVYFGTDKNAVTSRSAATLKGKPVAATLSPGALADNTTYYWAVDTTDTTGKKSAGAVWSFTTIGPGGGVKGEYFNGMTPVGNPALTRMDPAINFNWGNGGPGTPIGVDNFSARWTADLEIAVEDTYTFITTSDDGARLWLNDQLIIDRWVDQSPADALSKPLVLKPGVYSLRMEYYENGGGAVAQLSWRTATAPRQIIPAGPLQPPTRAKAVYPQNGDTGVPQTVTLLWSAGQKAVKHEVYFGADQAAVAAADAASGLYKGRQALDKTSLAAGTLEWNKTYYWRVDEVNDTSADSPWKGAVWSFTTADFLVVDDMESYTDKAGEEIFSAWIDGYVDKSSGSVVGYDTAVQGTFGERTIIHGGRQSMPLAYDNSKSPFYSEAVQTFAPLQDWTINGVTDLNLWVRGYPAVTSLTVTETGGKMSLTGSGTDIWNNSDQFSFAYKTLTGDGSIVARVVSNGTGSNTWAKGGVMIRDSLDGGSTFVNMVLTGGAGNGASFQYRLVANGGCGNSDSTSVVAPPYWVKVERVGDNVTGYLSTDGKTWRPQGVMQTIAMTAPVYIGLCVTSHAGTEQRTFQFDSIATTGNVSGTWQGASITSPRHNGAQPIYVVVEDSAGKTATASNATAANAVTWTSWKVPLSDLKGVNLAKVKKLTIGVGDRKNPTADGSGLVYIDDVRVTKP